MPRTLRWNDVFRTGRADDAYGAAGCTYRSWLDKVPMWRTATVIGEFATELKWGKTER